MTFESIYDDYRVSARYSFRRAVDEHLAAMKYGNASGRAASATRCPIARVKMLHVLSDTADRMQRAWDEHGSRMAEINADLDISKVEFHKQAL